ncbi:MAG: hypothetical protein QOE79_1895 [Sphingomonadales bacterium]|jgi:YVTN family beta-propeller protein|nr:hypothetical protein [Sphingomonadales bacterium]
MKRILALVALSLCGAAPAPKLGIVERIAGPDGGWDLLSVDADNHRLLVARSDGVMAVDLATGAVTPRLVPGARLHAVLAVPGSGIGLATSGQANAAILFDTASGAVRAQVPTGANPDAAIYDPASRDVWVMNARDGTASVIDPRAAKVVATVTIGGGLELPALDGRGHLFVNVEDKNQLAEIDLKTRTVIRRVALAGCDGPTGLAYLPSGFLLSACANKVATLVRATTGKLEATLAIGARPDGAFYDPVRRRAYVPAGGDGNLTVIDARGARPRVIATVPTQTGARTGTVDPATGRVYLPTARFDPPTAPGQRPKMVPGSFEVLVVGET